MVEKNEFYNARTEKDSDRLYLIKLFVKMGYPKHLYHLINNEQSIDFYLR